MKYLLDTDVVIDYLRDYHPTIDKLKSLISRRNFLYLSAITNFELHLGQSIKDLKTQDLIDKLFQDLIFDGIEINFQIAALAGDLKRESKMDIADALIAATAILNKCALVTRNIGHFVKVPQLKVIKL